MDLKDYMDANHVSASEMARRLGVAHTTVGRIAGRKNAPSSALIRKIVDMTGGKVSANDLLGIERNNEK